MIEHDALEDVVQVTTGNVLLGPRQEEAAGGRRLGGYDDEWVRIGESWKIGVRRQTIDPSFKMEG